MVVTRYLAAGARLRWGFPSNSSPSLCLSERWSPGPSICGTKPLHAIGDIHQGSEEVSSCSGGAAAAGWRFAACVVVAVAPSSLSLRVHVCRPPCMAPSRVVVHVSLFRCCRLGPSAAVRPLLAHSSRQLRGHRCRATHEISLFSMYEYQ